MKGLKTIIAVAVPLVAMLSMPADRTRDLEQKAYERGITADQLVTNEAWTDFQKTIGIRMEKYVGLWDLDEFYKKGYLSKDYSALAQGKYPEEREQLGKEADDEATIMRYKFEDTKDLNYGRKAIALTLTSLQYNPNGNSAIIRIDTIKQLMNEIDKIDATIKQN